MPSSHSQVMPRKCVTCHMYKAEKRKEGETEETDTPPKKGGHTFRPDHAVCLKCHEDAKALVIEHQAVTTSLLEQLEALLDNPFHKNSENYKEARQNYDMVVADGGLGVHNPGYAQALLKYSISSLTTDPIW